MIMRRLLMSTMICSGLALGSLAGAALPAFARAPQIFQPNTAWAVSKVEAKSSGSGEYCALARRFTGDMILTFARNARDESSLAIDFQRDLLTPNDTYFVTLKPGSGQDRMFEVKPVSGKAMVIRMGQDFAFYDALSRAHNLKIDISGQEYEFTLPDMAQGQGELNGCLAALVQPAAGGADIVPVAPPSSVGGAKRQLVSAERGGHDIVARDARTEKILAAPDTRNVVAAPVTPVQVEPSAAPMPPATIVKHVADPAVLAQVESLREENARLKSAMERERRNFEERFMQQNADSSKANELLEKMRLLEMENNSLREGLTAATKMPKPPPVTNELMDRVRLLETENEGLRKSLTAAATQPVAAPQPLQCATTDKTADSVNEALKAELAKLRDDNARLKSAMVDQTARIAQLEQQAEGALLRAESTVLTEQSAVMTQMQQRVAQLEEENAILRTKIKTQHVDAQPGEGVVTLSRLRAAEAQLQVVMADRDRLAKQIADIQSGKAGDLLAKAAGNWNLEEATRRFNEAEREIRRLGGQLEQERAKCAADVKRIEYMMFDPSIATKEQTAKLMKLEEEVMSFNANAEVQNVAYKTRIQNLEKTVTEKDKQLQDVRQRIAMVEGQLTEKDNAIKEGQKKIVALEKTLAMNGTGKLETTQKIAALEESLAAKDTELRTLQETMGGLQQKLAVLQQDVVSKDSQLKVVNEKLATAQQTVESLQQASHEQIAQQLALSEKQKGELAQAQAQLATLRAQREQLEKAQSEIAELSASQDALAQAQQRIAQLTQERTQLLETRDRLAQLEAEKAQLMAERNALQAEAGKYAQMQAELVALQETQASSGREQGEMARLAQEREILKRRVAVLEADKDALEQNLANLQTAAGDGYAARPVAFAAGGMAQPQAIVPRPAAVESQPLPPRVPDMKPTAPVPAQLAAAVVAETEGRRLMDGQAFNRLLQQAGIKLHSGIQAEKADARMVSYSWDTGSVYGSAEQQPMDGMGQFDMLVQAYLTKTGQRCGGEFAAMPGTMEDRNGARVATYEIACIMPNGEGASAALVFHAQDGLFTVIAHEAGMESMDVAMDVRDAVYKSMMQTRLASR